jgi:malate dehydrogenase
VLGADDWVTMGVPSDGSYGIPEGIIFGFPCECKNGSYKIVQGLEIDAYSQEKLNKTLKELQDEADAVKSLL